MKRRSLNYHTRPLLSAIPFLWFASEFGPVQHPLLAEIDRRWLAGSH